MERKKILAIVALALGVPVAGMAEIVGVNFTGGSSNNALASTDQPGVVAGANWNNVGNATGSNLVLNNSLGQATTINLTWGSSTGRPLQYAGFDTPATANTATNKLYTGGIDGDHTFVTLTNITYSSYDVYVYASIDDNNPSDVMTVSDGTTTYYLTDDGKLLNQATSLVRTTSTNAGSPTSAPGQYQVFHETSSSVTLSVCCGVSNQFSANLFGVEVVNTTAATPEPGTWVMMISGLAVTGLGRMKRRSFSAGLHKPACS